MKTINYKNANVMKTLVAAVIIMTSFTGITRGANLNQDTIGTLENESAVEAQSWMNGVEYNAYNFVATEMAIETESMNSNTETTINTFEAELALQVKYNAAEYVATELAIETETMNNNTETISNTFEAGLAPQVKYNAAEYVSTEIALETESRLNHNSCLNVSEYHINCGHALAGE